MLLYDIPLIKESLSTKCLSGSFTKPRIFESADLRNQLFLYKNNRQIIIAKTTSFELYKCKRSPKTQKIDLFLESTIDVYGQICNIQVLTTKISQSKQYLDLILVTLNTGQLLVYIFSREEKTFICCYREMIFKGKNKSINFQNPRNVGNYITCSEQNHFLISSVRCHKKLYQVLINQYEGKFKVNIKSQDIQIKDNHICWSIIWLPSMSNEAQYYGKYVAIEKSVFSLQNRINQQSMLDQRQQQRNVQHNNSRKLKYYYIDKNYKLIQKDQKKEGFRRLQQSAHLLIPVSSSSFFILYDNSIYLRELQNQVTKQQSKQQIIDLQFPLREALVDKNIKCMFSCYSRQSLQANKFRTYIMNESGDLFKLQYVLTGNLISQFNIRYTNSVKTAHSIVYLGQIQNFQFKITENQSIKTKHQASSLILFGLERFGACLYFIYPSKTVQTKPKQIKVAIRPIGKNKTSKNYPEYSDKQSYKPIIDRSRDLEISDQIKYLGVIVDTKIANLRGTFSEQNKEKEKQQNFEIFALTNSGNLRHQEHIDQTIDNNEVHKSYLKIIKKGLKIKQINSTSFQKPYKIFTFKKSQKDLHHKIIILCSSGKTAALTINNDNNLSYYRDLNFEEGVTTSYIGKLQDQSYVQMVGSKIRHIKKQKNSTKQIMTKNRIQHSVCLGKQVIVAILGGQIIFYEHDKQKDAIQFRKQFYVTNQIVSLELTPLQNIKIQLNVQKRTSRYLIIATKDYDVQTYRMTPRTQKQTVFQKVSEQNMKSPISSISTVLVAGQEMGSFAYIMMIGMENGSVIKIQYDKNWKKLNQKTLSIGSKPVKIKRTMINSKREDTFLIISDKTYIYYLHQNKYVLSLLAYSHIDIAAEMRQPQNMNTLMTYSESSLRILSIESFGQDFHDQKVDLFFSGKKLLVFQNNVGIIQADPSYDKIQKNRHQNDIDVQSNIIEIENLQKTWNSQFTIYKVKDAKKVSAIYFDKAKQICLCAGYNSIKNGQQKGNYLIFGCAEGISYYPKFQAKNQTIKVYGWITIEKKENQKENEYKTEFLYSLNIDSIPLVIQPFFKGEKFLIGAGSSMKLFQVGRKKLLLKAEVKNLNSSINQIRCIGKKIYVTSVADSFHLFKYIPEQHTFYDIAEDQLPKFITTMNILDSQTVCAADKFGNIFIGRLTQNAKNEFENTSGNSKPLTPQNLYKFNTLAQINVGEIVTSINKVSLFTSKTDVIVYSTIMGQIRVLYPLTNYEQGKVLPLIEQKIKKRLKIQDFQGNNWGSSKNVIQGQLVQKFLNMNQVGQKQILKDIQIIDENYVEYIKQMIEGIRNKII